MQPKNTKAHQVLDKYIWNGEVLRPLKCAIAVHGYPIEGMTV